MENNNKNRVYENRRYNINQRQTRKRSTIKKAILVSVYLTIYAVLIVLIIATFRSDPKGTQTVRTEEHTTSLQPVKPQTIHVSMLTSVNPIKDSSNAEMENQEIEAETEPIETEPLETEPIETETQEIEAIETESLETESIVEDTVSVETQKKIDWSQIEATSENSGYEHYVYDPGYTKDYVFEPEYNANGTVNYFGYTYEDFDYLSQCIAGEAGYCSWKWQMYVGSVVLNRVNHKAFKENTIKDICLAPRQYVCFDKKVGRVTYTTVNEKNKAVAYELLKNGSILPYNVVFQAEFEQGAGVYEHIGNTYFCYIDW